MNKKSKREEKKTFSLTETIKDHEQALLVLFAYIIGFTTAFIAFDLSDKDRWVDSTSYTGAEYRSVGVGSYDTEVSIKDGSLFVGKDGKERVLSAKTDAAQAEDGYHLRIITASVSPDSNYVHYCVQIREGSDKCISYLYSVQKDEVYRVKNGTEQLVSTDSETANFSWSQDGRLMLGNYWSEKAEQPWILVTE